MSRLTQVTVDRGDGSETGLDDIEITGFAGLLGGAGAETVTKLVGNAVVLFGRHPEQWQKILDDPEKIPRAVEEILRILPPSQYQGRFSHADREFDGVTLPAGFPVLLITGAATRDPRAFENPDDFDIERVPGISIGFGHGVHSCLGAALARDGEPDRARRARRAGARSRSTRRACNGCTCRTSRATRTSPFPSRAEVVTMRLLILIVCVVALGTAGCSSGSGKKSQGSATTIAPTPSTEPWPSGPAADLSHELTGGNGVFMGSPTPPNLQAAGYVEHEYAASGTATSYRAVESADP